MPTYSYYCSGCKKDFELFFSIKDYIHNPKCCLCDTNNDVHRLYIKDISTQSTSIKKADSELKTLGDLANRNRDKMSNDEKNHLHTKHNSYKEEKSDKPLPKGMSRMPKGKKIKWT
jgi:putative FmdB family regulatory protein